MSSGSGSLPSGTVTFLFTDIEGSTRLLQQLGDDYADVLAEHQRILRQAFAAHGGHEIDTQGDSFFVAFDRARSAIAAAVDAQRGLAEHDWAEGAAVRVRMGLHSGDPILREDSYTGMGVHRAARISAAGHGGQVLLSNATRELIKDDLPSGVRLRDLGNVKLKDLDESERVHQLVVDGLANEFPALRTEQAPIYRRPVALIAALAVAVVAIAGVVIASSGGGDGTTNVRPNSVAEIDPSSGKVVAQIPVGSLPTALTYGAGAVWVVNEDDKTVSRIDPVKARVVKSIPVPERPSSIAVFDRGVWIAAGEPGRQTVAVRRIDPQFDRVGDPVRVGSVVPGADATLAAGRGALWVAPHYGLVSKLDGGAARVGEPLDPKTSPIDMSVTPDAIWLAGADSNAVTRVDTTGVVHAISVGHRPTAIAVGAGGVWAADFLDDTVVRIDPDLNTVKSTTRVGVGPGDIAIGGGSVWVTNSQSGTVSRLDPRSGRVLQTIRVGGAPNGIIFARGKLWVTVAPSERPPRAVGAGTLRVTTQDDYGPFDPAFSYNPAAWTLLYSTCAKLLNTPDAAGGAGSQLVPEVATSLPAISDGGRTYTFTVRRGFRFSPPSNEAVTARTFQHVIERALSPKVRSPAASFFADIVGADAFMAGKARHVTGIVVRGDQLVIHLVAPAPDFQARIATPFACAIPATTPFDKEGIDGIPMAGPYYFVRGSEPTAVLARNPNYHGSRPHRFARIRVTPKVSQRKGAAMVEAGKSDWTLDSVDKPTFERLQGRYPPRSTGPPKPQLFVNPQLATNYVLLNLTRPLFSDARLRRAVSYAVDRRALAALGSNFSPLPQTPTDQFLAPGVPGFRDVKLYPFSPDVETAKKLAGNRERHAVMYSCTDQVCDQGSQIVKQNLAAIGIDVEIKSFAAQEMFARLGRKDEPYDLVVIGWAADFNDPGNFLDLALRRGVPGPAGRPLVPPYDDPNYGPRLRAASRLVGPRRLLAYGRLDEEIMRASAPVVAFGNTSSGDFFSARIGCVTYNPLYGMDIAALCVRKAARQ